MKTRFQTLEIFLVVFYYVSIRLSSSSPALISTSYYNKIHQPPAPSPSRRPESIRASLSFLPFHGSHSSPSFYHQNVYLPSPSTSSSSSSFPSSGSANYYNVESNLYSDSGPTTTMMLASSSSQPTMTAIPAPKPASQLVESSSSPMGIVFGRAISSYDGNYYIPVFYPISWINNGINGQMSAFDTSPIPTTINAPYNHHNHHHNHHHQSVFRMVSSTLNDQDYQPYNSFTPNKVTQNFIQSDEMMPSDVTPDINGNYKRSTMIISNSGSPSSSSSPSSSLANFYDMEPSADESNNYYHHNHHSHHEPTTPYIKIHDPKHDLNLAIEANKEQMKAQKHFEKEVLLADDDDLISRNFTKSYLLNDKNNLIQPRSSIVSKEPKIVTSIEIFDLPGANRYLGLSSDNEKINSPKMKKSTKTIKTFYKKKLTLTQNEFPKIVNQTKPN